MAEKSFSSTKDQGQLGKSTLTRIAQHLWMRLEFQLCWQKFQHHQMENTKTRVCTEAGCKIYSEF